MRKPSNSLVFAAIAAAAAAGPVLADDNGMTPHYGDSWADVQAHNPNFDSVPSLQAQTIRSSRMTAPAVSSNPPDPQAAPAAYSATPVAPGPAAIDAGATAAVPLNPGTDRAGPLGSGTTNTVDPTGVGAATMGGSPYGGNQDPARLPESTSTDVRPK
jgi:hypothetical protein